MNSAQGQIENVLGTGFKTFYLPSFEPKNKLPLKNAKIIQDLLKYVPNNEIAV